MRSLSFALIAIFLLSSLVAQAAPSVEVEDIKAKRIEMATDAVINDYCLYGKTELNENFILCTQMVGDMSRGVYQVKTPPLRFAIPGLTFQIVIDDSSFEAGELTYIFQEQDVENPVMKPSGEFFDQVKKVIAEYGPARLELLYIGEQFDTSLFGTPVPLIQ
ncbi:MAG: hypothetical protein HRT45_12580 [Bdellovibrionales bacterium]|nr:hypothetical protein [Bdellovibrionales bacterium]